ENRVHVGTYLYVQDFTYYLAAMREGASGTSWLVHNHFSAEPHAPAFMFPLYVGMGKLASAMGLSLLGVYGVVELLGRIALAVGLYVFLASFLVDVTLRRIAYVLAMFGGGLAIWERGVEVLLGLPPALG